MNAHLTRTLIAVSGRGDLVVALIVIVAVIMMIIPLPTVMVDVFIAANITISFLILLVCLYISGPTEFSSMPTVILIATVFRLAISITTARLVLLQADAGELVSAFGTFVIGGNIGVGLVIFLIITVAQFVVITKGSERVAEVAARFSLDAMPGKQMSIDSDLRSGDIDQAEARRLRRGLQVESQFYGAMDGTMKFVKGDAMAGLIVILVNLIGGLAVGTMQRGLPLGEAVETFSMLTIGDGLVAQIPALLVSIAAGTVVTRVAADQQRNLGNEIIAQLLTEPRALALAAAITGGLALIPGFPAPVFLLFAAAFGGGSYWVRRGKAAEAARVDDRAGAGTGVKAVDPERRGPPEITRGVIGVIVRIGADLAPAVAPDAFRDCANRTRRELLDELGVEARAVELEVDSRIGPDEFRIDFEGVPVNGGSVPRDRLLVEDDPVHLELLAIPFETTPPFPPRPRAVWVASEHQAMLAEAGVKFASPVWVLSECLGITLRRNATHFVGIQEARRLIAKIEPDYGDLVKELQKATPLPKIAEILRRLVQEEVPIRNLRLILEALIEWGQREQDVVLLVEYVRVSLRREICFRFADSNRVITAYLLDRSVEEAVRSSLRKTAVGTFLTLSEGPAQAIVEQLKGMLVDLDANVRPVVLTAMDIRRHVRNLLTTNEINIPVLSYQEIAQEFNALPLATISLDMAAEPDGDAMPALAEPELRLPERADGDADQQ
jgi:type III secretion protein V